MNINNNGGGFLAASTSDGTSTGGRVHFAENLLGKGLDMFQGSETYNTTTVEVENVFDYPNELRIKERGNMRNFFNSLNRSQVPITEELQRHIGTCFLYFCVPERVSSYEGGNLSSIPLFLTNLKTGGFPKLAGGEYYATRGSMFFKIGEPLIGASFGGIKYVVRYNLLDPEYKAVYNITDDTPETAPYLNRARQQAILLTTCPCELKRELKAYLESHNINPVYVTDYTTYTVDNAVYNPMDKSLIVWDGNYINIIENQPYTTIQIGQDASKIQFVPPVKLRSEIEVILRQNINPSIPITWPMVAYQEAIGSFDKISNITSKDLLRPLPVDIDREDSVRNAVVEASEIGLQNFFLGLLSSAASQTDPQTVVSAINSVDTSVSIEFDPVTTLRIGSVALNLTFGECGQCLIYPMLEKKPCVDIATVTERICNCTSDTAMQRNMGIPDDQIILNLGLSDDGQNFVLVS